MAVAPVEVGRFAEVVGSARVIADPHALAAYREDVTENPAASPSVVVRPSSVEQVSAIVRIAAEQRMAITPAVARMNVGGLAIPADGGMVLDLSDLTGIDLDREHMYAIVEPGVSFQQLTDLLDREAPDLTLSYPLAPPYVSVMANFLLDGLGSLSLRHGSHGEQIGGLEVVLPDGTVARTGACAVSDVWFGRGPLPDLTGLFVNWQGSSGVVTRLAVQLWRRPALSERLFVFTGDLGGTFSLVRDLAFADICHDVSAFTWPIAKMALGVARPAELVPGEPEAFIYFDLGADDEKLLRYKRRRARALIDAAGRRGLPVLGVARIDELIAVAPSLKRFASFPVTLDFLLDHPGGGLTWVGTYGPTARWERAVTRSRDIMLAHGFPPLMVTRPMKGGHFAVTRPITVFDKGDPDEVASVRALNAELFDALLAEGWLHYKAPDWAVGEMARGAHPGFVELFERVRRALDPAGVMNPARQPWAR